MLDAAGSSIDNCVQVKIFLTDMANFAAMNKVYAEFFHKDPKPVRTWYVVPSSFLSVFLCSYSLPPFFRPSCEVSLHAWLWLGGRKLMTFNEDRC